MALPAAATIETDRTLSLFEIGEQMVRLLTSREMVLLYAGSVALLFLAAWRQGWRETFTRRALSGTLATLGVTVVNLLFVPVVVMASQWLQSGYDRLGIAQIPSSFWDGVHWLPLALVVIVVKDFADYWNHRAMHLKWLWPLHAIHHSDEEMNGFTTLRVHFLEGFVMAASYVFILSWLNLPAGAAAGSGILVVLHNAYVHTNLDWDHGPLRWLVASPRYHRWHHAKNPAAYGKNLANVIPAYDWMFGTYYNPHPCRDAIGADGVPHADVTGLMTYPFVQWGRMIRQGPAAGRSDFEPQDDRAPDAGRAAPMRGA
ncbi:MAG: sterol desaturase family protein [Nitratireductor sp.]|nr:sterol desaturase family protein [Nitratireductor sp.]